MPREVSYFSSDHVPSIRDSSKSAIPCLQFSVKFGSNSSVGSGGSGYSDSKMPGAQSATPSDVSNAERVKFGSGPSTGSAMPGAISATEVDVSQAERLK